MKRQIWCITGIAFGLILLICAVLVPAHFRGIDFKVIERAGIGTPSLVQSGVDLVKLEEIGAARMVRRAARLLKIEGHDELGVYVARAARLHVLPPRNADSLPSPISDILSLTNARPVIESLAGGEVRHRVIAALKTSSRPAVQEILKNLALTNTTQFPPVNSSAGQPLETAIALAGLLVQTESISSSFRDKLESLSKHANGGGNVSLLETVYLDLFSLGKRLDWSQLTELMRRIDTTTTLQSLAGSARASGDRFPLLYAAAILLDRPQPLVAFVETFPESGLDDLAKALSLGRGSLMELMRHQKRIYSPSWREKMIGYDPFGAFFYLMLTPCRNTPGASLIFRCLLFLGGASLLAFGVGSLAFTAPGEDPASPDRSRLAQTISLALSLFLVLFASWEPFIVSQASQKVEFPIRVRLPMVRPAAVSKLQTSIQHVMTTATLTSLIVFFVLQALIYIWCLAKISEIRRQTVEPRLKLRLLDNEEHLFDAGLYLGFVGTIISLILVSMGIVKPSIMAAYSSTSFGIIFVSILKIFHLRPLRRQLIMESEVQP